MSSHQTYTRNVSLWSRQGAAWSPEPAPAAVDAAPLLLTLLDALGDQPSPCGAHPDRWTSDKPDDVAVAVAGCAPCPALHECLRDGHALDAHTGRWGGHHLGADGRRRPSTTERERVSA